MRTKTHSAATGYVYLYAYKGYREVFESRPAREYIFNATRDRKQYFAVTVQLRQQELAFCHQAIGRDLLDAERYAIGKLTLLEALDTVTDVAEFAQPLVPSATDMERHLSDLGRI